MYELQEQMICQVRYELLYCIDERRMHLVRSGHAQLAFPYKFVDLL